MKIPMGVNPNRLKIKDVEKIVKDRGGTILEVIRGPAGRVKYRIKCNDCGYIWAPDIWSLKIGNWCAKCNKIIKDKLLEFAKNNNYEVRSKHGKYIGQKEDITLYCGKHKYTWNAKSKAVIYLNYSAHCKECKKSIQKSKAGKRKKPTTYTDKEIKDIIKNRDAEFIRFEDNKKCVVIRCNKDEHVWKKATKNINKSAWCRECYKKSKYKYIDIIIVEEKIKEKNWNLLSKHKSKIKISEQIKLECPRHKRDWETSCRALLSGNTGCQKCTHNVPSDEEIKKFVESKNATIVEIIDHNAVRGMRLKCNIHNHEWLTNHRDIRKGKRWCTHCAREDRKTSHEKIKLLVESKGGELLTKDCTGSLTRIDVRCEKGHEWETYFDSVNQGYWCPVCVGKAQAALYDIIKEIFPDEKIEYNFNGFDWLRSPDTNYKLEIDILLPNLKLAVEYDGEQHFRPVKFGGISVSDEEALQNFKDMKKRDFAKNRLIGEHKDKVKYFIRFNYKDNISKEFVLNKLKKIGMKDVARI